MSAANGNDWSRLPFARFIHRLDGRAFVLAGWTVLRFTWDDITLRPKYVIAQIRAALAMLRRRARRDG